MRVSMWTGLISSRDNYPVAHYGEVCPYRAHAGVRLPLVGTSMTIGLTVVW